MGGEDGDDRVFCPHCGELSAVQKTVPWQADLCKHCGCDIEASQ